MSTELPNKLPHTRQASRIQLLSQQEEDTFQPQIILDTKLHHIYDKDITVTSQFTSDGRMPMSRATASEEIAILAKVSTNNADDEILGRNPASDNYLNNSNLTNFTNAPNDAVHEESIIDDISAPTNQDLPSSLVPWKGNDVNSFNIINGYFSSNQGLGSMLNNLQHTLQCFRCLKDELGTVHISETTILYMAILSKEVSIPQWESIGSAIQDHGYYRQVTTAMHNLSKSSLSNDDIFYKHCQWSSRSNGGILDIIANINGCTNLVLEYNRTVEESHSFSQAPIPCINFLQKLLHGNVFTATIPGIDRRTIIHLPPVAISPIMHIANTYQRFRRYAVQHGSRWNADDVVPVQGDDYSFKDIVTSAVYSQSKAGYDHLTAHLNDVIKQFQMARGAGGQCFPVALILEIRQLTLLLEWMCQQIILVSVLQEDSENSEDVFMVVKLYLMYHRYDYFLVIFLAMLDATLLIVPNVMTQETVLATTPIIEKASYTPTVQVTTVDDVDNDSQTIVSSSSSSSSLDYGLFTKVRVSGASSQPSQKKVIKPVLVSASVPHIMVERNAVSFPANVGISTAAPRDSIVPSLSASPVTFSRTMVSQVPLVHTIPEAPVIVPISPSPSTVPLPPSPPMVPLSTSVSTPSVRLTPKGNPVPAFLQSFHHTLHPLDPSYFVWSLIDALINQKLIIDNQVKALPHWLFVSSLLDSFSNFISNQRDGALTVPRLYAVLQDNFLANIVEVLVGPPVFDNWSLGNPIDKSHKDECSVDLVTKVQDESCQNFKSNIELHGETLCMKPKAVLPKNTCLIYIGHKVTVSSKDQLDQLLDSPSGDKLLELDTDNKFIAGSDRYICKANTNIVDSSKNTLQFDEFTRFGLMRVTQDIHGGETGAPVWVQYAAELKGFVFFNKFYMRQLVILSNVLQRYYSGIESYLRKHKPNYVSYTFQEVFTTVSDYIERVEASSAATQRNFLNKYLLPKERQDVAHFTDMERIIAAYIGLLDNRFSEQIYLHFYDVHYNVSKGNSVWISELPINDIPWYFLYPMADDCKFTKVHSKGLTSPYDHPIISRSDNNVSILVAIDPDGRGIIHTDESRIRKEIADYRLKGDSSSSGSGSSTGSGDGSSLKYSRNSPSSVFTDPYRSPLRKIGPNPVFPDLLPVFKTAWVSDDNDRIDRQDPAIVPSNGRRLPQPPASPVVKQASIVSGQSVNDHTSISSISFVTPFSNILYLDQSLPDDVMSFKAWNTEIGGYPTTGPLLKVSSIGVGLFHNYYDSLEKIIGQALPPCTRVVYDAILMYTTNISGLKYLTYEGNPFEKGFKDFYIPEKYPNFAWYVKVCLFRHGATTCLYNLVQALLMGTFLRVQEREFVEKMKRDLMIQPPTSTCTITTVFSEPLPTVHNIRLLKHMLIHLLIWYLNHFDGVRTPESIYRDINALVIDSLDDLLLVCAKLTHFHNILGYTEQTLSSIVVTIHRLLIGGNSKELIISMRQLTLNTLQEKSSQYAGAFIEAVNALPIHATLQDKVLAQINLYSQIIRETVEQMSHLLPKMQTYPFTAKERPSQPFKISRPVLNSLVDYTMDSVVENLTDQEHQELVESVMKVSEYKSEHLINAIGVLSAKLNIDFTSQYVKRTCSFCGLDGHDSPNCRRRSVFNDKKLAAQAYQWMTKVKMEEALNAARTNGVLAGTSIEDMRTLVDDIIQMKADKEQKRSSYLAKAPQYGPGGGSLY